MSLLPEHKKSAVEIAQLRESLGIAVPATPAEAPPDYPAPIAVTQEISPSQLAPLPSADAYAAKPVRSLRRTERIPILPVEAANVLPEPVRHLEPPPPPATPLPILHSPKPVRSLRKSEQAPIAPIQPPPQDSKLPIQRHSGHELSEIRRHEALVMLESAVPPPSLTAHRVLIIPGYLFALVGAACFYYYELEIRITAACVIASLLVAIFIFFKKPLSRHHAAFIAVAALFVIVFGALYYFPQLRHGT